MFKPSRRVRRANRRAQFRRPYVAACRPCVEALEDRRLLAVVITDAPAFSVLLNGPDDVAIGCNSGSGKVQVNGGDQTTNCSAVTSVSVDATRTFSNNIDLTDVAPADFTSVTSVSVNAGPGEDTVVGSPFADLLLGDSGEDSLFGGAGNDTLSGGSGDDTLAGSTDTDTVIESNNTDFTLTNSALVGRGADQLSGLEQAVLTGGDGENTYKLTGWFGSATLNGGDGVDTLVLRVDDTATLSNTLLSRSGAGSISLSGIDEASLIGGLGNDTVDGAGFSGPMTLHGGVGDDSLVTGGGDDSIYGGFGNDSLLGLGGHDTLDGGFDADRLNGSVLHDSLFGGAGNDTLIGGYGDDVFSGGAGFDILLETFDMNFVLDDTSLTGLGSDSIVDIDAAQLTGGVSNNQINARAFSRPVTLSGAGGNDALRGGAVGDLLLGGPGNDFLGGERGGEKNSLTGGAGNDTFAEGTIVESGDVDFTLVDGTLIGNGTDTFNPRTNSVHRAILIGGDGDNTIDASGFNFVSVTLIGGGGNDTLIGSQGSDSLAGGDGDDFLDGQEGNDTGVGGPGTDTFINIENETQ